MSEEKSVIEVLDSYIQSGSYPTLSAFTHPLKKAERDIIGREKEMAGVKAALARPELCNVILLGDAGSGKAHPNDTLVPVNDPRGYVRIGDLVVGDEVFDENGNPCKVTGVFPRGLKHLFEVTFKNGAVVPCNDEHLWAVRSRASHYSGSGYHVMELRDIVAKGIKAHKVSGCRHSLVNNWYVPKALPVVREEIDFPVHPYVVGCFIGDGCCSDYRSGIALFLSSNDVELVDRVTSLLGSSGAVRNPHNYTWSFLLGEDKSLGREMYISRDKFAAMCGPEYDCVFHAKSVDKRIPDCCFLGSYEQRMELLRGLLDTDGCLDSSDRVRVSFSTNGEGLAHDVMKLAASLGISTSMSCHDRQDAVHRNMEYEVFFSVSDCDKPELFHLQRYKDIFYENVRTDKQFNKHYDDLAITDVRDCHKDVEMTCIMVDSPSHLYQVTERHIVTHNTMLVQGLMAKDKENLYLEVDLSKMLVGLGDKNEMAARIKSLFDETAALVKESGKGIILFIDEFHQIVQLSDAAVEALKPMLADSGTRGIRVIAATTYVEFRKWVAPNQPLVERLQRFNIKQPGKDVVVKILEGMARRYNVASKITSNKLYDMIYEYTERYVPANSQPRKSILLLDAMIGWNRSTGRRINSQLLADVIYDTEGVNVAFRVDARNIKKMLDKRVYAQELATTIIEQRLQICVADLNAEGKPMSSFLFTGSTGVGKGLINSTEIPVFSSDGSVSIKRNGDLKIGDYVFNRKGEPVKVVGVFPRGKQDIYKVSLNDGRVLYTDSSHLWTYMLSKGKYSANTYTNSTKELYDRGVYVEDEKTGKHRLKYWIPMNEPVQYPEAKLSVHPYVMGAFIGDGCLTISQLTLSSGDRDLAEHVAELLGVRSCKNNPRRGYNWTFPLDEPVVNFKTGRKVEVLQTDMVFADYPEVCGKRAVEKHIPDAYMHGSIEQRWQLVKGLFDTDGTILDSSKGNSCGRYSVSYSSTSLQLIKDLQNLLYSLGVASTWSVSRDIEDNSSKGNYTQYRLSVKSSNEDKDRFFWLPRKVAIAEKARELGSKGTKSHNKDYHWVGISDIELMPYQDETTCIYVDDEEHLYQAGQFVVTHNTEVSKALAEIMFNDPTNLIRMDMTEFALPESLERFRNELTSKVWARPYCIILLDEIEKAAAPVTRLLLQVLDDGRLIDENNREVTFKNAYVIMTTNAGSEIYNNISHYASSDTGDGMKIKKYNKLIRRSIQETTGDNRFPPELLGRIDCLVPFQPLSINTMKRIAETKLNKMRKQVADKHGIHVDVHNDVVRYLVEDNLDADAQSGGARAVVSKMESEVVMEVARYVNLHKDVSSIVVNVEGEMACDNKHKLESDAHIVINAVS